ncbi:MAG: Mrp/NBP35 family ATP-binding protein [Gammaproteobacteria bacterium]|nr:Mrp/NBP35 family ATP-binding protein [Gammaproteobacteria bacterium]MCH9717176.1 Mrp/NBP35 family ATP-binding protein [Gammaproteobacteria bacterium]MCH9763402.1 Mrp/NBP35 family ATP-binding protein [Gammaproteobacteria bacterium]
MNIKSHITQLPGKQLRGIKNTIAIGSGKGGVGKSTVTVNLAAALTKLGARVGILDADIYGPSIPQLLGQSGPVQYNGDKYLPVQAHGIQAMSIGYLTEQAMPLIWRGPMLAKSMIQLIDATQWDELDYLLIDLPPGTGDIQLSLVQKIPLTAALIVTTPQTVATADAEKALLMFQKTNIHVLGLIENMAEHICTACGHHSTLFGEGGAQHLAETHGSVLLGQLPLHAQIRENADNGTPSALSDNPTLINAFRHIAMATHDALSVRPLNYADKFPPIVVE